MKTGEEEKHRALLTTGFAGGGTRLQRVCAQSYHDVTVTQLEAVKDPRCRRQQGAHGQREGQTLHVAGSHHFHLQKKKEKLIHSNFTLTVSYEVIIPLI